MDDSIGSFEQLMERVRSRCPLAQRELVERFDRHVRRAVSRLLPPLLRARYDEEDFSQTVWAAFFTAPDEQYLFPNPASLVAFLTRTTYRKVMEVTRQRLETHTHGSARALSLDAPNPNEEGPLGASVPAVVDTPSQIAIADERWQLLVQGLPPGHRRILELLRDGYTSADVIRMLPDVNRYAIERLLDKLSRDLEAS